MAVKDGKVAIVRFEHVLGRRCTTFTQEFRRLDAASFGRQGRGWSMEEIVEEGMSVLHCPSAFLVSIFPDTDAKCRLWARQRLASGIVMLALGHSKRRVLLAQLLKGSLLGAHIQIAVGPATNLGKVERVFGTCNQTAGLAANTATPPLSANSTGAGRATIAAALLAGGDLVCSLDGRGRGAGRRAGAVGFGRGIVGRGRLAASRLGWRLGRRGLCLLRGAG